jgi:hypothetical protein
MGDLVAFPKKFKAQKTYKVFVTIMAEWQGSNAEHAALNLAGAIAPVLEPIVDFHKPSRLVWGEYKAKKNPQPL